MKIFSIYGLSLLLIGLFNQHLAAQQGWEFGAFAGVSSYYGDLNPQFSFRRVGPAFGAFARKNFDGRLCLRIAGSFANVGGNDEKSKGDFEKARNLSFSSNVFEGSLALEFNFQPFHTNTREDKKIVPYLLAGFGVFKFDPTTIYNGARYRLQPLGTEGQGPGQEYKLVSPAILLGGGLKIELNPFWSLNLEVTGRMTFTDYLDDVSGTYADYRTVAGYHGNAAGILSDRSVEIGERIGAPGRQRGDSKGKDSYLFCTIGIVYRAWELKCAVF